MTTIKRFVLLLLLAGTFLGGYYVGHKPGSPDLFATAEDLYRQAGEAGRDLTATTADKATRDGTDGRGGFTVRLNGKTYQIGGQPQDR